MFFFKSPKLESEIKEKRSIGSPKIGGPVVPIFISCDPHRDTVEVVREYLKGDQSLIYFN